MRLHLAGVEIKHGCPLGIQFYIMKVIALLIDVLVEFPNSYPIIKHLLPGSVLGGIDNDRHQIDARFQSIGFDRKFDFIGHTSPGRNSNFTIVRQPNIGNGKRGQIGPVSNIVGFD